MKIRTQFKLAKLMQLGLVALALAITPAIVHAQDTTNAPAVKAKKSHYLPFFGKVKAVDTGAETITIGKRTFDITSATKITNGTNNAPAVFSDVKVGGFVGGTYVKKADGKLTAHTLHIGKKAKKAMKSKKKKTDDSSAN